ncbi:hypothetical protein D9C73_000120 [Collichthys lucidus]|uniref:Uncharacterized protein n=1 Tax=Collichthys lucidus TaxID=240159 RepID=A0A4U5TWN6_COLLU|nr:hypothetical protein D9C73_000120 [Collichthys lucidus]
MNDWTEVRYGRRRWRRPQGTRDWSRGRPEGRVDSAPSFRFRREDFPFPNQPVPPPSATWYPGPRYRSYADAIPPRMTTVQIQDRIQSPREPARKRTVATMTGEAEDQPLQPTDWHQPPLTSPPPSPPGPPRGQRHGRRTRGTVVTEDSFLQDEPEQQDEVRVMEEPPHTPTHSELEAPFDELQAEEKAAAAITSTPQSSVEVTVQRKVINLLIDIRSEVRRIGQGALASSAATSARVQTTDVMEDFQKEHRA